MSNSPPPFKTSVKLELRNAGIITKKDAPPVKAYAATLTDWLRTRKINVVINDISPDLAGAIRPSPIRRPPWPRAPEPAPGPGPGRSPLPGTGEEDL